MVIRIVLILLCSVLSFMGNAASAEDGHLHEQDSHAHDEMEQRGDARVLHEKDREVGQSNSAHEDHDAVMLSPEEIKEFGIVIDEAQAGLIEISIELPGEVKPNADRLAHIVPRFSGIVTKVNANVGDDVRKGQVLAVVEGDESLAPFSVTTLFGGTVIDKHITLGEAVSRDSDAFVIADLSSVWVDITVYQRDILRVKVGQKVGIYVGHDLVSDAGIISYITPILDEHTRTATARVVLPNENRQWRPGMFVTAKIIVESQMVHVAVPSSAIHTFEGNKVVFVEEHEALEPRPVVLGWQGGSTVEVASGLAPGSHYVSEGGFVVKAELGKEAFGDGHGH